MAGIAIIKTGSTHADLKARWGDFHDWIAAGLCLPPGTVQVVDAAGGETLPAQGQLAGVVITGSHAMVTERLPWSERLADWLAEAVQLETPILGICYGHQLLAHALGGVVGDNPNGREYGTVEIQIAPMAATDALLGGLLQSLYVPVGHVQSVLRLPEGAFPLASSRMDACQAFRWGKNAWGVQFHPEFNAEITRAYIRHNRETLQREGQDADLLLSATKETPQAAGLLRQFGALALAEK